MAQILLNRRGMAPRNDDLPPHLRRAPAERPQLPADQLQDRITPEERNTRRPQDDLPPPRNPYLRRNAGIASPPPYERN